MLHIFVDMTLFFLIFEWLRWRFQIEPFAKFSILIFDNTEIDVIEVLSVEIWELLIEFMFF